MTLKKLVPHFIVSFVAFVLLDLFWFCAVSGNFFFENLRPIANTGPSGESMRVGYADAGIVYALLALGMVFLVRPSNIEKRRDAILTGALYGLIVYGVYDFTNHATLAHWPVAILAVDVVWGTLSCLLVTLLNHQLFAKKS